MGTSYTIDTGDSSAGRTIDVSVDGSEWATFDGFDSTAIIKSYIEGLSTMSGKTVTVTTLTSTSKWQLDFSESITSLRATFEGLCLKYTCEEGTGSTVGDSSGQGNDATLTGTWTDHPSQMPNAVDTSSGTYITPDTLTDPPTPDGGMTFFCRFKNTSFSFEIISYIGNASGTGFYWGYYSGISSYYIGHTGGGTATFSCPADSAEHTIVIRVPDAVALGRSPNLSDTIVYIDGVQVSISVVVDVVPLTFGSDGCRFGSYDGGAYPIVGNISHIGLFNVDKGDAFAIAVDSFDTPSESGCVVYYRCDEGSGTTITDYSGNGCDGTIGEANWLGHAVGPGDLYFANDYGLDCTGSKHATKSSPISFPTPAEGMTISVRFKFPSAPGSFAVIAGGGNSYGAAFYVSYYTGYGGILFGSGTYPYGYNAYFAWTPDTAWHTVTVRCPAGGSMADTVMYLDGVEQSVYNDGDNGYAWDDSEFAVGSYTVNLSYGECDADQVQIWRGDKGDTFVRSIQGYNDPHFARVVNITPGPPSSGNASQMIRRLRLARAS